MRALRATGNVFIVLGLTLLLFVAYELVGTSLVTDRHQDALAAEFDATLPAKSFPVIGATPLASPTPKKKKAVYSGPPPLARIRIPKIGVNEIVVEGVSIARLAYGPGHYPSTPRIGAKGVTGIAGHRTGWGSPFIDLDKLVRGDEVVLETKEATYTYRVTNRTIVDPGDGWVLGGDPKSKATHRITLTTCTPKYTSRDRLIVWGDLVETVQRA